MQKTLVPPLGFPGEQFLTRYLLAIPTPCGDINVYGWQGELRGYNLFLPDIGTENKTRAASFKQGEELALLSCIHNFLETTYGGNHAST